MRRSSTTISRCCRGAKPIEVGKVEANGLFATAKLKTYPARLNAAIVLRLVDRFAMCSDAFDSSSCGLFLEQVYNDVYARCICVEGSGPNAELGDQADSVAVTVKGILCMPSPYGPTATLLSGAIMHYHQ